MRKFTERKIKEAEYFYKNGERDRQGDEANI
jgi:hypothetical protein